MKLSTFATGFLAVCLVVGAGMDHFERAVGFIRYNMPRGVDPANPQLGVQEAWDVAAFLQSRPRPHYQASR